MLSIEADTRPAPARRRAAGRGLVNGNQCDRMVVGADFQELLAVAARALRRHGDGRQHMPLP